MRLLNDSCNRISPPHRSVCFRQEAGCATGQATRRLLFDSQLAQSEIASAPPCDWRALRERSWRSPPPCCSDCYRRSTSTRAEQGLDGGTHRAPFWIGPTRGSTCQIVPMSALCNWAKGRPISVLDAITREGTIAIDDFRGEKPVLVGLYRGPALSFLQASYRDDFAAHPSPQREGHRKP
jgi:hypothetical protein